MKYSLMAICLLVMSCRMIAGKRVDGNGIMKTETRDIRDFRKIEVAGDFDVEIQPSDEFRVTVQADENLMQFLKIRKQNQKLEISEADGYNLHSIKGIRLVIQMPVVEAISVAGSGSVSTTGKIESPNRLQLDIAGGGGITMDAKSPKIVLRIGGSGNANLRGITKDFNVSIGGSGNCMAADLKSENCDVSIGGSGTANVFASISLEASIGGSGNVYYAGRPQNVKKSIGGSGSIEEIK